MERALAEAEDKIAKLLKVKGKLVAIQVGLHDESLSFSGKFKDLKKEVKRGHLCKKLLGM